MHTGSRLARLVPFAATAAALLLGADTPAWACGCFANPTTAVSPSIQAGERIVFSVENGVVTMTVQIAYTGKSSEFGWLMPLPSVPTLKPGTDELFARLEPATAPTFVLNRTFNCRSSDTSVCFGAADRSAGANFGGGFDLAIGSPLVIADSVGPFDYAVLKADDKTAMINWLADNRYIVPANSDKALVPYIHPGAYFLALKLKSGKTTGDIQPIVVSYASDLPMIPITLTSIGAVEHMGILVWVLGPSRAIPRNYHHTVLNEAAIDWATGNNYDLLLQRAVAEAPEHHTFVTEFAGSATTFAALFPAITLTEEELAAQAPLGFTTLLRNRTGLYPFTGVLQQILREQILEPKELINEGVTGDQFYATPDTWIQHWHDKYPSATPIAFDSKVAAHEVITRVVEPHNTAGEALRHYPYLTRLHTALSPSEMTADPVFSFNPQLPDVAARRTATLETDCDTSHLQTDRTRTEWPGGLWPAAATEKLPASLRIENLRESGDPEVVVDNTASSQEPGAAGCTVGESARSRGRYLSLGMAALALLFVRLRGRHRRV